MLQRILVPPYFRIPIHITSILLTLTCLCSTVSAQTPSAPKLILQITIDGLHVDDSNPPENYQGMYLLGDPGGGDPTDSPFPYARCEKVIIHGLTTASGVAPRISPVLMPTPPLVVERTL